jgi:hypothetical protein
MGKLKGKRLCKLVKDGLLDEDMKGFEKLVVDPTHLCTKCGRACNRKKLLCEPKRLD